MKQKLSHQSWTVKKQQKEKSKRDEERMGREEGSQTEMDSGSTEESVRLSHTRGCWHFTGH